MLRRYRRSSRDGFTLIEILVVITVIAILAALVSPMVFRNVGDAKSVAARSQIETLGLALDTYRLDNDYYPATSQGLAALERPPGGEPAARNWRGPYLKKLVPPDPWGLRRRSVAAGRTIQRTTPATSAPPNHLAALADTPPQLHPQPSGSQPPSSERTALRPARAAPSR